MSMLSVSAQTRLLVVAPHPDDETLGCGILIQRVLAAGGAVRVLLLTDGDNNPWPQRYIERRWRIDGAARQRWGARRRAELARALAHFGLPASALHALGWPDMGLTARLRDHASQAMDELRAVIAAFGPNLMTCPALRDSHPDHGAAHVLCRLALAGVARAPDLLAYPVHGAADPSAYPILVDAAPEQRLRKRQAMDEHASQMALSAARMHGLADSPERYMPVAWNGEGGYLPWRPPALLRPWMRLLVATPSEVRDFRWADAPLARSAGGDQLQRRGAAGPVFAKLHLDWPSPWIFDHWGWHVL